MRAIVVGDVHGCWEEFQALLAEVKWDHGADRLVLLGDLVDRGPEPIRCLRWAIENGVECVLGNHEEKHARYFRHAQRERAGGKKNPMRPFPGGRQYEHDSLTETDVAWIEARPAAIDMGGWLAVHGGFLPGIAWDKLPAKVACRVRWVDGETGEQIVGHSAKGQPEGGVYWPERWTGPTAIYGHNVHDLSGAPKHWISAGGPSVWGIDTGCCFGGALTAAIIQPNDVGLVGPESLISFASVPARGKYADWFGETGGAE